MDDKVTLQEIKDASIKFSKERAWGKYHSPKNLAISATLEAAELLEPFRFVSEAEAVELLKNKKFSKHVRDELSDLLFNLCLFAQMYGVDLSDAFKRKMADNAAKYPVARSKGRNKKYTEYV